MVNITAFACQGFTISGAAVRVYAFVAVPQYFPNSLYHFSTLFS